MDESMLQVSDETFINIKVCSGCILFKGALTHTKPQVSYFAVVDLFSILIKT